MSKSKERRKGRDSNMSEGRKRKREGQWDVKTHKKEKICLQVTLQTKGHVGLALKGLRE